MRFPVPARVALALTLAGVVVACVISTTTRPAALPLNGPPRKLVSSPVKAHLLDGSVIVFESGAAIGGGAVAGQGQRWNALRTSSVAVTSVPLDSVLGMEVYERQVNPGRTLVYGTVSLAAATVGSLVLAVAIFGSCPTIYADSAGTGVRTLQGESFSYSIAPLLAKRDVDRLDVAADTAGVVRLDVRNEALETHYIDHLELVEVRHAPDETVLPAPRRGPIAVRGIVRAGSVRDAAGREVRDLVEAADGVDFASDTALLARAAAGGPVEDHLDLVLARPAGRDSLALVLRMRASLLSTSVLYTHMLADPGASSLDWVGRDLAHITTVAQVANWYAGSFGLRVSVLDGGRWRPVARLMDFGPAAWRNVGVVVPAVGRDSVRVRLSFVVDEYRIDRVGVAWELRDVEQRTVPVTRVVDADGAGRDDMAAMLRRADDRTLQTQPGSRFGAEFDVGRAAPGTRTFLVAAHGYYVEWMRGSWLRAATDSVPFSPARTSVRDVLRHWRTSRDTLERRFFVDRVPTT